MRLPSPRLVLPALAGFALLLAACSGGSSAAAPIAKESPSGATAGASASSAGSGRSATAPSPAASPGTSHATGAAEYDGTLAMAHIQQLSSTIGPRLAGSAGEQKGVDYIAGQLRSFGYTVEIQPFEFTGSPFRTATLEAGGRSFEALAMSGSGSGTVRAPAAYVGLADDVGIAGQSLQGKIAVADRGTIRFGDKLANVTKAGALALVVINNEDAPLSGNAGSQAAVPVVGAAGADRDVLVRAAKAGDTLAVAAAGDRTAAQDILARPAPGARCDVLVGGHFDTVPGAPGALDNASGVATALELARAFAADGLDQGLCFAAFSGEESGLFGSKAMVSVMKAAGQLPRLMVNLDMTALGDVDLIGDSDLQSEAAALASKLNIAAKPTTLGQNFGSDHQSFKEAGVPVLFFSTSDLGKFHTPGDTIATLDPVALEHTGDLAFAFIAEALQHVARS